MDDSVLSRSGGAYCFGDMGQRVTECGQPVVVDRNDCDVGMPLLRAELLVSGDESGEPVQAGLRQQLVVAQRAPLMKDGALDWRIAERSLEG